MVGLIIEPQRQQCIGRGQKSRGEGTDVIAVREPIKKLRTKIGKGREIPFTG